MSHLRKVSSDTDSTLPRRSSLLALGSDEQRRRQTETRFHRIATILHEAESSSIPITRPDYNYYVKPAFDEARKLADEASRTDVGESPVSLCRSAVISSFEKAVADLGVETDMVLHKSQAERLAYLRRAAQGISTSLREMRRFSKLDPDSIIPLLEAGEAVVKDLDGLQLASVEALVEWVSYSAQVQRDLDGFLNDLRTGSNSPAEVSATPSSRRKSVTSWIHRKSTRISDSFRRRRPAAASLAKGHHRPELTSRQERRSKVAKEDLLARYSPI
ncbi:hypothetical protein BCR35DRAFT_349517 [Leucosporidium creatinivorum]|uniref:Uncharacterized protein n=1 Tax=Leucosporidium creatinivorum TaxID=106004 RepID=A0A1Y2G4M4_9BASI|nr:hypothetical protein BCR35DRAFT_349517 [Leucosporidium creatinivorum]